MIYLDKMLRTSNEHAQVDFFFIKDLGNAPILHTRDKGTVYPETIQLKSRDVDLVANTFVNFWINSPGPPKYLIRGPRILEYIFSIKS